MIDLVNEGMNWRPEKALKHSTKGLVPGVIGVLIAYALFSGRIDSSAAYTLVTLFGMVLTAFGTDAACLQTKFAEAKQAIENEN